MSYLSCSSSRGDFICHKGNGPQDVSHIFLQRQLVPLYLTEKHQQCRSVHDEILVKGQTAIERLHGFRLLTDAATFSMQTFRKPCITLRVGTSAREAA